MAFDLPPTLAASLPDLVPGGALLLGCVLALGSRQPSARPAGALVLASWIAVAWNTQGSWVSASLFVQAACALLLVYVAVRSRPYWVLGAAALQLLAVPTNVLAMGRTDWRIEAAAAVWCIGLGSLLASGALRRGAASNPASKVRYTLA